jgi:hypothetical protein
MRIYDKFRRKLKIDYPRDRQVLRVGCHCSDVLSFSDATGNRAADAA